MNTPPAASATRASGCDVLVIGGGSAGATAAALLAERGYRVTLLEKAHHPRFHIGESLLPANLPLLEKLGVADAVKAIGMEKWGAEFVSPWHDHKQSFEFADAMDKSMPIAYQVRRAEFGKTPIHGPLLLFKGLYYAASLLNCRRTLKAWRMRKHNIRVVDETGAAMN